MDFFSNVLGCFYAVTRAFSSIVICYEVIGTDYRGGGRIRDVLISLMEYDEWEEYVGYRLSCYSRGVLFDAIF